MMKDPAMVERGPIGTEPPARREASPQGTWLSIITSPGICQRFAKTEWSPF